MGWIKAAMGDALITAMWVFSMPVVGVTTSIISSFIGVEPKSVLALFITVNVVSAFIFSFSVLSAKVGGANFNPSTSVAFYAAGLKGETSLTELAVQLTAQAVGGVAGVMGVLRAMPKKYSFVLGGPALKVDMQIGAAVEGAIAFSFCLAVMVIFTKGPGKFFAKVWLLSLSTVALKMAGNDFTGAPMNPANAYGWAYANKWHNSWELFYVYWIAPLIGATLAAWVFKKLFMAPVAKKKTA